MAGIVLNDHTAAWAVIGVRSAPIGTAQRGCTSKPFEKLPPGLSATIRMPPVASSGHNERDVAACTQGGFCRPLRFEGPGPRLPPPTACRRESLVGGPTVGEWRIHGEQAITPHKALTDNPRSVPNDNERSPPYPVQRRWKPNQYQSCIERW